MNDRVTHDENAFQFMQFHFPNSKKQSSSSDRYITDCPTCGHKNKFWWSEKMPHNGGCFACDYQLKSVFELGYRTEKKTKTFKDMSDIKNLVSLYRNKTGKTHRLSDAVIKEFGLKPISFIKQSGNGTYYNIAIPDDTELECTKHLNFDGRWISIPRKYRNDRKWLNSERVKPSDEFIYVLAGEWDLMSFWENTGHHGISPVDGEGTAAKLKGKDYDIFSNKKVIILFDNDKIGRSGSQGLAKAIQKAVKVKSIKVPDLANLGLEGGQDIDDFFAGGGTKDRLQAEIDATPEFSVNLTTADIELERIQEVSIRPSAPYSTLDPSLLDKLWKVVNLPESVKEKMLDEIAESEGLHKYLSGSAYKQKLKVYDQELKYLRFLAHNAFIEEWIEKFHVKKANRHSDMSESVYLYYQDGYYQFLSDDALSVFSREITEKIISPDSKNEFVRSRKTILEEMKLRLIDTPETDFESHKPYINFENGTYILKSRDIVGHSPDYLLNYKLPIVFDAKKDCPNFKVALTDWTYNAEDERELLKALYYLISGDRSNSVVFWLQGDGHDGKSEFINLCRALVGERRTSSLAIEALDKTTHYTAELYNKMLNIADEVPKNYVIPDAIFKRITGNSVITADPKYKGMFSFISRALWIIPSNNFPSVSDTTKGYFRRFKIFKFKGISKEKNIPYFFDTRLKPELAGITNLILTEGRKYYESEGFKKTETEIESTNEMKGKNNGFLYWQNVFAEWEETVKEKIEELKSGFDYSTFSDTDIRQDALRAITRNPTTIDDTDKLDVIQGYDHKVKGKIYVMNPNRHYDYYKEYFKDDEVHIMSLNNFRATTFNFYKDYWPDRTIEKIEIFKRDAEGKIKKFLLHPNPVNNRLLLKKMID